MRYEAWDSVCSWDLQLSISDTRVRKTELRTGEMAHPLKVKPTTQKYKKNRTERLENSAQTGHLLTLTADVLAYLTLSLILS